MLWVIFVGRVGGRGGRPGKGFGKVLLVLGQALAEHLTRLAPPSKDGVGGFIGSASCRRPLHLNESRRDEASCHYITI